MDKIELVWDGITSGGSLEKNINKIETKINEIVDVLNHAGIQMPMTMFVSEDREAYKRKHDYIHENCAWHEHTEFEGKKGIWCYP